MKLRHLFFACSGVFVMMFSLLLLVVIVFSDEEDGGSGGNLIYGGVSVSQEVLAHKPMWCTVYYLRFDMQSVYNYRRNDCRISGFSNILSLKSGITNNRSQFLFVYCCSADYYNYLS